MRISTVLLPALLAVALAACADPPLPIESLRLPPGFSIEVLVRNVPNARALALGSNGTLFVGSRDEGKLYAVEFRERKKPRVRTLLKNLNRPTGIAFRNGALYVAEVQHILRFDDIEQRLDRLPKPVKVADLPSDAKHGWRYLGFGPDDKLYVPIGAPCNVCEVDGYGVITRMNPDGSDREIVARGVRNSVGFTWHPVTGALVFTDNGRDRLGNDVPLCELNMVTEPGQHFGFPFCHSGTISDPEFGHLGACEDAVAPLQNLGPHVAPLGVKFYTGDQFPAEYQGDIFIAEHGSWNRDDPIGYRLTRVKLSGNTAVSYDVFIEGWLQDRTAWGRPVDILVQSDGAMLVSDDLAGVVYRVQYSGT